MGIRHVYLLVKMRQFCCLKCNGYFTETLDFFLRRRIYCSKTQNNAQQSYATFVLRIFETEYCCIVLPASKRKQYSKVLTIVLDKQF
jgi:hypothetical protein